MTSTDIPAHTEDDYKKWYADILKDLDELYAHMITLKEDQSDAMKLCEEKLMKIQTSHKDYKKQVLKKFPNLLECEHVNNPDSFLRKYFKCRILSLRNFDTEGCTPNNTPTSANAEFKF